jgi:hypothetical protein
MLEMTLLEVSGQTFESGVSVHAKKPSPPMANLADALLLMKSTLLDPSLL